MVIEKHGKHLWVLSGIFFDEMDVFCSIPYVFLSAFKEPEYGWDEYSIGIAIHDYDDFDVGLVYKTDAEHFDTVLHELINWMNDHEQGTSRYIDIWETFNFFPDCGCERKRW